MYAVAHSVVEAVSGIEYPAVSEVTPVELLYVRPVAVFAKRPRRYAGVRAVVEAYAAFQFAAFAVTVLVVVFQAVVLAVSGILYPAASVIASPVSARPVAETERLVLSLMSTVPSEKTPVPGLYWIGDVPENMLRMVVVPAAIRASAAVLKSEIVDAV